MNENTSSLLPLLVNMDNRKVVIFGGGQVGERKAALFCRYADTTVISRSFTPELQKLGSEKIRLIKISGTPSEKEIADYVKETFIVVPTTSDLELNKKIEMIARRNNCLINSVDGIGDITVPSIIERGDIILAISTGGASPALSKYMRLKLEETFPLQFEDMAKLLKDMRQRLKQDVSDQADRSRILWAIINDKAVWAALDESYDRALGIAMEHKSNRNS